MLAALALCAVVSSVVPGTALAATASTSATLTAGTLSITRPLTAGTFAGTLTGLPQSLAADASGRGSAFGGFQVRDARGSGAGWSVTVSAGRLVNADGSGHAFALASLIMPQLAVAKDNLGSAAVPGTLHGPAAIDNSADGATGGVVMAATSAFGQGMGTYDFTAAGAAPWMLAVPADAFAGTYASTVTTTLGTLSLAQSGGGSVLFSTDFSSMAGLALLMGSWQIVNGVLVPVGAGEHRLAFGDTKWTNVQLNVNATLSSGRGYGIYFRADGQPNIGGYCFQYDPGLANVFDVRKVMYGWDVAGPPLASAPIPAGFSTYGTAHTTTISAVGSHIVIKVDGVTMLDFYDSTFASGSAGLRSWGGSQVNFLGAQVLSGGAGVP